jgi:hypothetical protein
MPAQLHVALLAVGKHRGQLLFIQLGVRAARHFAGRAADCRLGRTAQQGQQAGIGVHAAQAAIVAADAVRGILHQLAEGRFALLQLVFQFLLFGEIAAD